MAAVVRRALFVRIVVTSAFLLSLGSFVRADAVPAGRLCPLAVEDGRCSCVVPTDQPGAKYFLIVSALAQGPGPYPIHVQTEATADPVALPLEHPLPEENWRRHVLELRTRLERARLQPSPLGEYAAAATPPAQRTFYLFAGDQNFEDLAEYVTAHGQLRGVGSHCQVYVDREADPAAVQPTVDDILRTFDGDVYPVARQELGRVLDVDRDGRFTVLLSGWLGKLQHGKVSLGGFVRGSDFYRDLPAPYGNGCDVLYLNTDLKPGPYLRTILAHEYTHAVVFSEHVFGDYLPEVARQDEANWLNEALAHLAEERHGYSWRNLDYRVSTFLNAPERYPLVVPDYYRTGQWRNPGDRGATFLFLRWCVSRHGSDLPRRLIQTNLSGVTNLEVETQEPFADLFRGWSASLLLSGTRLLSETERSEPAANAPSRLRLPLDLRSPLRDHFLCGARFQEMPLASGQRDLVLAGTSSAYLLLHSPGGPGCRVTVTAEPGTALQVSLVRSPDHTGRLSLRVVAGATRGTVRLALTAHDTPLTLDGAAWERLVPGADRPEDTSYREGDRDSGVRAWFGEPRLDAGDTRLSTPIPLPEKTEPILFKVTATDAAGHRLSAWGPVPESWP